MPEGILNRLGPIWDQLCQQARHDQCATAEDLRVFQHRICHEGLPYITDGLGAVGRLLLDGIRRGYISEEDVAAAGQARQVNSTLPTFLYAAWSKIFTDDGYARGAVFETTPSGPRLVTWEPTYHTCVAVRWLRQLTTVFSKLRLPYAQDRVDAVAQRFITNEQELATRKGQLLDPTYLRSIRLQLEDGNTHLGVLLVKASRLISKVLCNCDPRDLIPRHGSGASACSTRPWERYTNMRYHSELDAIWPYDQYCLSSYSKEHDQPYRTGPEFRRQARCVFVQKDYRGPRLISCEPAESMYFQQGLMTLLVDTLEHHPMTRRFVNFTDQSINQRLAVKASVTRAFATLDLKDASDLVSWDLIQILWPKHWLRALTAVRSRTTRLVREGRIDVIPLRKHAPMGSAVCFPVMALTLWALIKAACPRRAQAWVYGDDIITRSRDAPLAIEVLEAVGLKINRDKSFILQGSPFRESCGVEYFAGHDVTPIYLRYDPTTRVSEQSSLVSFANNLSERYGPYRMFEIIEHVAALTGAPMWGGSRRRDDVDIRDDFELFPFLEHFKANTKKQSAEMRPLLLYGLVHASVARRPRSRWNSRYQRREYHIRVPVAQTCSVNPDMPGYVLRAWLINSQYFGLDCKHALAKRVRYKYRWVCLDW